MTHSVNKMVPATDDAFSRVPYEKGYNLLMVLEGKVGEERFLSFLRDYIMRFRLKTVVSDDFVEMFGRYFPEVHVDWQTWLRGTGMPHEYPTLDDVLEKQVNETYERVRVPEYEFVGNEIDGWRVNQIVMLLEKCCADVKPHYRQMGVILHFNSSNNYEIKYKWVMIIIMLNMVENFDQIRYFLATQGRIKYVRPIYRLLIKSGHLELAQDLFNMNRDYYQLSVVNLILKDCPQLQ